jgi:hypothetical protein
MKIQYQAEQTMYCEAYDKSPLFDTVGECIEWVKKQPPPKLHDSERWDRIVVCGWEV